MKTIALSTNTSHQLRSKSQTLMYVKAILASLLLTLTTSTSHAHFIINDYTTSYGNLSTSNVFFPSSNAVHPDPMEMFLPGEWLTLGVPAYYDWEDSPERKACLIESARDKLHCEISAIAGATVAEIGILLVGTFLLPAGGSGAAVIGAGTAVNAGIYATKTALCDYHKTTRDVSCPA